MVCSADGGMACHEGGSGGGVTERVVEEEEDDDERAELALKTVNETAAAEPLMNVGIENLSWSPSTLKPSSSSL